MDKKEAIKLFGRKADLARAIGISKSAVGKWPPKLSARVADRVHAAVARRNEAKQSSQTEPA